MSHLVKIPKMERSEYDQLLFENHVSRIAFTREDRPYSAPFIYVFDGKHLYFLPSRYGKKMELFKHNPHVAVEIEDVAHDMSRYRFITLSGKLEEVTKPEKARQVREMFANLIQSGRLSENALKALGIDSAESISRILDDDRSLVWELRNLTDIVALKDTA